MQLRDIQHIIEPDAMRVNDAIWSHALLHGGPEGLRVGIWDERRVDFTVSHEQPKYQHWLCWSRTTPYFSPHPHIVFTQCGLVRKNKTRLLHRDQMTESLKKDHGGSWLHSDQHCGCSCRRARHEVFQQQLLDSDRHAALSGKNHALRVRLFKLAPLFGRSTLSHTKVGLFPATSFSRPAENGCKNILFRRGCRIVQGEPSAKRGLRFSSCQHELSSLRFSRCGVHWIRLMLSGDQ